MTIAGLSYIARDINSLWYNVSYCKSSESTGHAYVQHPCCKHGQMKSYSINSNIKE